MKHKYLKNVATLELDLEKCVGCNICTTVCPHHVLTMNERKVDISDKNSCMECGACMKNCPTNALSVIQGVGCASAIIKGFLTGSEPSCDCSDSSGGCC